VLFCFERHGADEHSWATTRCLYSLFPRGGCHRAATSVVHIRSVSCVHNPCASVTNRKTWQTRDNSDRMQGYRWRQYGSPPRNDCAPSGFSRHLGTPLCLACPQASYGRQAGWDAISGASAPLGSAFSCGHRLTRPTNLCAGQFKAPVAAFFRRACSARPSWARLNTDRAEPEEQCSPPRRASAGHPAAK